MKHNWHRLIAACLGIAVAFSTAVHAAGYPDKPIRMIVGYVPGGGSDISARILADALEKQLGHPVVVQNMPGASSIIAVQYVGRSRPDGYTLLHTNSDAITILPAVRKNVPYSVPNDFTFISRILEVPLAIAVNPKLPIHSVAELIAYAKAHPGKLRYGTSGVGSGPHLAGLLLCQEAHITMTDVPYRGSGGAINDLIGGHIDLALPSVPAIKGLAAAGSVRAIAVTGPKRDPSLPAVPTLVESGLPGATVVVWYGLLGPAHMAADVVSILRKATVAALNNPQTKARYKAAGFETSPLAGDAFEKYVEEEADQWKAVAASAHISIGGN